MSTLFYSYPFAGGSAITDPVTINPVGSTYVVNYYNGFTTQYQQDLSTTGALPVPLSQTNQILYDITNNIRQYQTQGVPFWITPSQNISLSFPSGTPFQYPIFAQVAYNSGTPNYIQIWENQVDLNTAVPGADNSWTVISGNAQGTMPGTIIDFGGASAPAGYLLCDGNTYLIADYMALYAAIGLLWGPTPASGSFNVPNLQTFITAGQGGSIPIISGTAVGSRGGSLTHLIAYQEMPPHNHPGGTVATRNSNPGGSASIYGASAATNQNIAAVTLPYNPATGTQTEMTIVQPTALVLKCIKY